MRKWRWLILLFSICSFGFLVKLLCFRQSEEIKYIQCDVGQGDAILFVYNSFQILYDSGGGDKVIKCLDRYIPTWDKKIEIMIVSHGDKDHIGGFNEVLRNYGAKYFVWNGVTKNTQEWNFLKENIENRKIKLVTTDDIKGFDIFKIKIRFMEKSKEDTDDNEISVVTKLSFGKCDYLLTGDIGENREEELVNSGIDLDTEVLKVSHHGSKYSSSEEFLNSVKPVIATIGVGTNSYGHPDKEVISRLEELKVFNLRTDLMGNLVLKSNGEKIIYEGKSNSQFSCN